MTQSEVIAAMEADAVKENMNRDDHEKEQEKGTAHGSKMDKTAATGH